MYILLVAFIIIYRAEEADVIVVLIDSRNNTFLSENNEYIDSKKTIIAYGKSDLVKERENDNTVKEDVVLVSSFTGEGIDNLKSKIVEIALKK